MQILHKSHKWNRVLGKIIIKPTWKNQLGFEEVFIKYFILFEVDIKHLHGMDHISPRVHSRINMKGQNIQPSRRLFMESLYTDDLNLDQVSMEVIICVCVKIKEKKITSHSRVFSSSNRTSDLFISNESGWERQQYKIRGEDQLERRRLKINLQRKLRVGY